MLRFNHYNGSPTPIEKINTLYSLLKKGTKDYKRLSVGVENKEMKTTILILAQESNQYASDLNSLISSLKERLQKNDAAETESNLTHAFVNNDEEVFNFCHITEEKVINAYREILNEPFLNVEFRKMISYQLNGTLCSFMQLKLMKILCNKRESNASKYFYIKTQY